MKIRNKIILLVMFFASAFFIGEFEADAYTVSDNGEYTFIMSIFDDGDIDGEYYKVVKFDFDEGETTVKLSDLTKGVVPFNGRNTFSGWKGFGSEPVKSELTKSDFSSTGDMGNITYTKGYIVYAEFSNEILKGTGKYYVVLDGFAGKISNKEKIRLESDSNSFQTIDLSKYTAVRKGYTFLGWGYKGKFVTSIDASYFSECDAVEVTAVYKKDTFEEEEDSYILKLDANGGTIENESSKRYEYIGGANSGASMPIFQFVPERAGYTFKGWNSSKDGTGKFYKYMYWGNWRNDGESVFERDTITSIGTYKNLTLYAIWEKLDAKDIVNTIISNSNVKGNIEFKDGINKNYTLDIKPIEVSEELKNKNVRYIADINVLDNNRVVKISDTKLRITLALPEELKGYNNYEVVYIKDGVVVETLPATIKDGNIIFETTHLSEYGIVATNNKENIKNPKTFDNIYFNIVFLLTFFIGLGILVINKKKMFN